VNAINHQKEKRMLKPRSTRAARKSQVKRKGRENGATQRQNANEEEFVVVVTLWSLVQGLKQNFEF